MMIAALVIVGAILQGIFIVVEHKEKYVAADILKGTAAFCFVLIFNTFSGKTRFSMRITNLSLYYIGQMMIALCLFL